MAAAPQRVRPDPAGCPRRKSPFISYGFIRSGGHLPCPPNTNPRRVGSPGQTVPCLLATGCPQVACGSARRTLSYLPAAGRRLHTQHPAGFRGSRDTNHETRLFPGIIRCIF